MQYKVPQNVDMEDRVFGPLSLRQFTIILVGIGLVIFLWFVMVGFLRPFFFFLAFLILGFVGIIALGKYGSQTFEEFFFSALQTFSKPRQRVWKKVEDVPQMVTSGKKKEEKKAPEKQSLSEFRDDLSRLAFLVDSGGSIDIAEKDRVMTALSSPPTYDSAPDILARVDKKDAELEKTMDDASKKIIKHEPLVSEIAKVSPDKNFSYPTIEMK